jgi:hypothetical protein
MTIYSPLPLEVIWNSVPESKYQLEEYILEGVPVQAMVIEGNRIRIERILSTDPSHYLNPGLQPGQELEIGLKLP